MKTVTPVPAIQDSFLREIEVHLHDLCQPVTALQCRLELGRAIDDRDSLSEAVVGGLEDTQRIFAAVRRLRDRLAEEDANRCR
jgi:signal transduction histidine kinase